jgi:hypothetical protein
MVRKNPFDDPMKLALMAGGAFAVYWLFLRPRMAAAAGKPTAKPAVQGKTGAFGTGWGGILPAIFGAPKPAPAPAPSSNYTVPKLTTTTW